MPKCLLFKGIPKTADADRDGTPPVTLPAEVFGRPDLNLSGTYLVLLDDAGQPRGAKHRAVSAIGLRRQREVWQSVERHVLRDLSYSFANPDVPHNVRPSGFWRR